MTIVEVRGRGGQLIERVRTDREVITVGRAFDNDVILEDAYVSAHHLRLTLHDRGWLAEDLGSANGTYHKKQRVREKEGLDSGDRLRVGHTYLHLYSDVHLVSPVLKIDSAEARLVSLGRPLVWTMLIVLTCMMLVFESYSHSFAEYKPLKIVQPALWSLLGVVLLAAVWALVGRLARHRAYFFCHLSIWYLFGLSSFVSQFVSETIAYNLSSGLLQDALVNGSKFLLLVAVLWSSLTLATNLKAKRRSWSALGLAGAVLIVGLAGEFRWQQDFTAAPSYYAHIKSPSLLWAEGKRSVEIVSRLPQLLERATEESEKVGDSHRNQITE